MGEVFALQPDRVDWCPLKRAESPHMDIRAANRVAANLRAEMARRRVTPKQLAQGLGLSQSATSRRLTGETPLDVNELASAASLLGITIAELVGEAPAAVTS